MLLQLLLLNNKPLGKFLESDLKTLGEVKNYLESNTGSNWSTWTKDQPAEFTYVVEHLFAPMLIRANAAAELLHSDPFTEADVRAFAQNVAQPLMSAAKDLLDWKSRSPNDASRMDALPGSISNALGSVAAASQAIVAFEYRIANMQTAQREAELVATQQKLDERKRYLDELVSRTEKLQIETSEVLATAREAAQMNGFSARADAFRIAADTHKSNATTWIGLAAAFGVVLLVWVIWSMACGDGPPLPNLVWTAAANLSHFAARLLGGSLLSFLLVVCVRNFRAERHNEVVSRHRLGAIQTFEAMVQGANEGTRNAVTLQATEAVFSMQPTGYSDKDVAVGTHVTELFAAVKSASHSPVLDLPT